VSVAGDEPEQRGDGLLGVVARGADGVDELLDLGVVEGTAAAGSPRGLGMAPARVAGDQPGGLGTGEQSPERGHAVLPRGPPVARRPTALGAPFGVGDDGGAVLDGDLTDQQ
jgi:hypothetical protein